MEAHRPVMLQEVVSHLVTKPEGVYVDGTFGRGGHSRAILNALNSEGRLYAFDKDPAAIEAARELEKEDSRFKIFHASFAAMSDVLSEIGLNEVIDGVFLDLGVSSPQLDDPNRGFSFMRNGPLDMRMDTTNGKAAATWLTEVDEKTLKDVLKEYGEERFASRIARAILNAQNDTPITTTEQLAEVVAAANPSHEKFKHPATRTFQAIRIYLNKELDDLSEFLAQCLSVLKNGGRLLIISFHSLEDRLVKRFMKKAAKGDTFPKGLAVKESDLNKRMTLLSKAMKPSSDEINANPRARSAVLRMAEKIS